MRIEYKMKFEARCPVDGSRDTYDATLVSSKTLMAEGLRDWAKEQELREIFQEDLTKEMASFFDCEITLVGWHKGIRINSCCGSFEK